MTLLRSLAIISASLLILNSCGGKKESAPEQPKQEVTDNSAEDLFDEFYDSTDASAQNSDNTPVEDNYAEETPVEEVTAEQGNEIPAPNFSPDGRYVVQISCVASDEIAEDVARKLENSGYPVYVAEVQNPTPTLLGTYYRIRIGGFENLTAAKSFGENHLMPSGFEYWIDNRSNDNVGIGDFGLGDNSSFENAAETYESTESYETVSSEPATESYESSTESYESSTESYESSTESYESSTESFVAEPIVDEAVSAVEESTPYQEVTETVEEAATEVTNTVSDVEETVAGDDEWGTSEW